MGNLSGGVAGGLMVKCVGMANCEPLNHQGHVIPVEEEALANESPPFWFFSPQALLAHDQCKPLLACSLTDQRSELKEHFRIFHNGAEWQKNGLLLVSVDCDFSFLPCLTLFPRETSHKPFQVTTAALHFNNCNKMWMCWHIELGHLAFAHVQKLAMGGFLDKLALRPLRSKGVDQPECTAGQCGEEVRLHDGSMTTTKNPLSQGSPLANSTTPGHNIFSDQMESRVRERLLHTGDKEPQHDRFCGSAIFWDAASKFVHLKHHITLNASDSI